MEEDTSRGQDGLGTWGQGRPVWGNAVKRKAQNGAGQKSTYISRAQQFALMLDPGPHPIDVLTKDLSGPQECAFPSSWMMLRLLVWKLQFENYLSRGPV